MSIFTTDEYETILNSLCSLALENFYLNEKDHTPDEIVELAKAL